MLKRLRKAHPILFCVLAEVVFLASLFVTDLVFTIALVLFRADFASIDTYLYSTLQELVGAMVAVLFLVRTDRAGLLRRRGSGFFNGLLVGMYPAALLALSATVVTDRREIAADDFFQGLFATALEEDELITAVRFPQPHRAAYLQFRQPPSLFALIGVFVAQTASGVRVAVTGGGNGVFRHAAMEEALGKSFTPDAAAAVTTDPAELNGVLHGSAESRANLAGVMSERAAAKALE